MKNLRDTLLNYLDQNLTNRSKRLGATSLEEQCFCQWYGQHVFNGVGEIVELGPWLGSLTIPLAEGLCSNRHVTECKKRIHAYDRFRWDALMERWVEGTKYTNRVPDHGDFLPLFREITHEFQQYIVSNRSDLAIETWIGEPIEFLLNDATKTLAILRNVIRSFFPSLVPGESYIAHQDYLWFTESHVPLAMHRLRGSFKYVLTVPNSGMVLFKCTDTIPDSLLDFPENLNEVSKEEINDACRWNQSFVSDHAAVLIDAGCGWSLLLKGDRESAQEIFRTVEHDPRSITMQYQFQKSLLPRFGVGDGLEFDSMEWCFTNRDELDVVDGFKVGALPYWDRKLGWLWTTFEEYPKFYAQELNTYIEYQPNSKSPRVFRRDDTGEKISV